MPTSIKTGGGSAKFEGTATASQVLDGATFYSSDKEIKTGTMTNRGAVTQTLNAGGSYTIPAGYHNGSGKVTANSLASQTDGTATASQILTGQTAYVDGAKVTGTMANQGAKTSSLNCGGSYTIPAGYHNGSGKITANSLSSQTSATATASQILSSKTAWVNGSKITGTIPSLGATTYTPTTSNQTIASGKYLSGTQTIKGDSNLVASNILSGKSIFGVSGNVVSGIGIERYCVDMIPSSTSGFLYGTTYTFYWNSSKTTVDYTDCIVINSETGEIIDVSGGVGKTFSIGTFWTATLTSNGFTYVGGSYQNDGQAHHVTLIKFKNAKSKQIIDTTSFTKETLHTLSSGRTTDRYYVTIEAVDPTKTIILNFGGNDSEDFVPMLLSSTKLQVGVQFDSSMTSLRTRCLILETK